MDLKKSRNMEQAITLHKFNCDGQSVFPFCSEYWQSSSVGSVNWFSNDKLWNRNSISDKSKHLCFYHLFRSSAYIVDIGVRSLRFEASESCESPLISFQFKQISP